MLRKIIRIEEEKCDGCGLCAEACHEGAIGMVDGKAKLLRDDYCDGLGDCLPACPTGAISFEVREAAAFSPNAKILDSSDNRTEREAGKAYDEVAVKARMAGAKGGCPGSNAHSTRREGNASSSPATPTAEAQSDLRQWPVQIKLVPVNAPYFDGANLLVAADCAGYARANFHSQFMRNKVTLIGCPKLDMVDYSEKLGAILKENNIKSVTAVRMEVPCCGGIEQAVISALKESGKMIPWQVVTLATDGAILEK